MNRNSLIGYSKSFLVSPGDNVDKILNKSNKATCGIMEREIIVNNNKVAETKRKLKAAGFNIIGTSEPNGNTRKVWFIRAGGF